MSRYICQRTGSRIQTAAAEATSAHLVSLMTLIAAGYAMCFLVQINNVRAVCEHTLPPQKMLLQCSSGIGSHTAP